MSLTDKERAIAAAILAGKTLPEAVTTASEHQSRVSTCGCEWTPGIALPTKECVEHANDPNLAHRAMSPADRLRAAAQRLLDTAEQATPGPWVAYTDGDIITTDGEVLIGDMWPFGIPGTQQQAQANAAWIALLGPDKAQHLAAWLDHAARQMLMFKDNVSPYMSESHHYALAFADSILGKDTP